METILKPIIKELLFNFYSKVSFRYRIETLRAERADHNIANGSISAIVKTPQDILIWTNFNLTFIKVYKTKKSFDPGFFRQSSHINQSRGLARTNQFYHQVVNKLSQALL